MRLNLYALLTNKSILKINSLCIGYALWALFTSSRYDSLITHIPIAFYNTTATHTITAPERVAVTLQGPRSSLRALHISSLALHIDAHALTPGMNKVAVTARNLLLPQEINLINCTYINCIVTP